MISILVLEDEKVINDLITYTLKDKYKVYSCTNVDDAMDTILSHNIDLIITDLVMSGLNGFDFLDFLRDENQLKPILVVSSMTDEKKMLETFDYNVIDFITKPFNSAILARQVDNLVNLYCKQDFKETEQNNGYYLNLDTHEFHMNERKVALTRKEFDVLKYLVANKHRICTREEIFDDVWETGNSIRVVDTIMKQLRKKLNEDNVELIRTVHGAGYKYEA